MLGTAPVWGARCAGGIGLPRPENNKDCCGTGAGAGTEDGFPLASEATGVSGLAERCSAALFDLADERRVLDEVAEELRQLRAMLLASGDLVRLIRSPVVSRADQAKAIAALAERAGLSPLVRHFLGV